MLLNLFCADVVLLLCWCVDGVLLLGVEFVCCSVVALALAL